MTDTSTPAVEAEPLVTTENEPVDNHDAADLAAEGEPEPEPVTEPEPTAEAEPEPQEEDQPKPKKESWELRRFKQENAKRHEAERKLAAAEAALAAALAGTEPTAEQQQPERLTQAQIDQRAHEIVQANTFKASLDATLAAGAKEFGTNEFNEACNLLADIGANDRPEFLQTVIAEENGHKLLQHLGQNPDEAERILSLPPLRMASALAKLSVEMAKPKPTPVSAAPAPIRPLDGRARAEPTPDRMNDDEFTDFFEKKMAAKRNR